MRHARQASFDRILEHAPLMFTSAQLRVFLNALVNLDPFDFAEDVAEYLVGDDENNQLTPEEILSSAVATLPDEKLTGFALRLALTGHMDIPRESDFDYLAQAEAAFVSKPQKSSKKPKGTISEPAAKAAKKGTPPVKKAA